MKTKTVIVTGASRGIGQSIAFRFAKEKANVVVLSKDSQEQLDNTKSDIESLGGKALVLETDISDFSAIESSVKAVVDTFGSIDILINNTSATCFTDTLHTEPGQFDLVMATSVKAAFFMSKVCHKYLKDSDNPHIINISPPLTIDAYHLKDHLAFSMGKYAMSMCTLSMAQEFKEEGIAVNSLWPRTTIATQTIKDHFSDKVFTSSRWPEIMGDAAFMLSQTANLKRTGHFYLDEELLKKCGVTDFSKYAVDEKQTLMQSLFLPKDDQLVSVTEDLFLSN